MYTALYTLQIAEQKMYEHWKQNAPELREVRKALKTVVLALVFQSMVCC